MRVFITGVAGFLGSHLADAMLQAGHQVSGIDNLIGGEEENIPDGVRYQLRDCSYLMVDPDMMEGVDLVYHCAALAYEGLSVFSPYTVIQSIVGSSTAVFTAAIRAGVKRIVHCSSMARYGELPTPFREFNTPCPKDPYGIAKKAAEDILRNLCTVHGVEYTIAVPHNIIGPRQKYNDPYRNVASIMINRMLQGKAPIIYGDGTQKRCFSFIDDCLHCLVKMGYQNNVLGEVINIGPDEEAVSINQLAGIIMSLLGPNAHPFEPIYMPGRPQEVKVALCSSEKARKLLEYSTKTSLSDGLAKMIAAIRERGVRPFEYHLPIEIVSEKTPKTWTDRIF